MHFKHLHSEKIMFEIDCFIEFQTKYVKLGKISSSTRECQKSSADEHLGGILTDA